MKTDNLKKIWLSAVILIISGGFALAQEGRGRARLNGEVIDEQGKPVADATVVLSAVGLNFTQQTKTNAGGQWGFLGLGTATFRITVTKDGYHEASLETPVSQAQRNPRITITLQVADDPTQPSISDESSRALFEEANRLFDARDFSGALAKFQEFLEINPAIFLVRLNIGNCLMELKEYDRALAEYQAVLQVLEAEEGGARNKARVLASIGEVYMARNMFEQAMINFKKSLEMDPNDHALAFNVAEILFNSQKVEEALEYYEMALKLKPDFTLGFLKAGYALLNKGDIPGAVEHFEKYLQLAGDDPEADPIRGLLKELKK